MKLCELDYLLRQKFGESEEWDSDGIKIDLGNNVSSVLVCLDCTTEAIEKAVFLGADTIITHHPLIFHPINSVENSSSVGKRVINLIKNNISLSSYHTCFDKFAGGTNDVICEKLGLFNVLPFIPCGRIGKILCTKTENFFDFCEVRFSKTAEERVVSTEYSEKIAVIAGSGKGFLDEIIKSGADTVVTGEVSHDFMIDAHENGLNLICLGHHVSENVSVQRFAEEIKKSSGNCDVQVFDSTIF